MTNVYKELGITFKDSQVAFKQAIDEDRLSFNRAKKEWAGNFMYMGTDNQGRDMFKNIVTREYI